MHSDPATFLKHYRPGRHSSMQDVILDLTADQEWERTLTSISRWRDKRRQRHLNDMGRAVVERDLELERRSNNRTTWWMNTIVTQT
jgi:hypothetical protein